MHKANASALMDFVSWLEDARRLLTSMGCKYSSHVDNQDVIIMLMRKLPDRGLKRKWVDRVPLKCPQCSGLHGVWRCWLFKSSSSRDHLKNVRQNSVSLRRTLMRNIVPENSLVQGQGVATTIII